MFFCFFILLVQIVLLAIGEKLFHQEETIYVGMVVVTR